MKQKCSPTTAISEIVESVVEGMLNVVYGPDSDYEICINLTFTIFPITPFKLAGHVNVC